MAKRSRATNWAGIVARNVQALSRIALRAGRQAAARTAARVARPASRPAPTARRPPPGAGDWFAGLAVGPSGGRRYRLYRPASVRAGESLPLLVMLHGCGQDAAAFARSTRMNAIATRERFLVLYPEQDSLANAQGCWNWFETRSGRAQGEVALILAAIDQACLLYRADRTRVAICGLSAGAGMAALAASRHPDRFVAVAMHSGVRPGAAQSSVTALAAMQGGRHTGAWTAPDAALPPLLVIQGTDDAVVVRANARAAAHAWAHAGDARATAPLRESAERRVKRGLRHELRIVDFKRGTGVVASLIEIDGLGHAWSGGGAGQPFSDPAGPDVSRMVWAFVAKQLRRPPP
jgi:poly(hydroxyalkanoate) depolymerase family esterase